VADNAEARGRHKGGELGTPLLIEIIEIEAIGRWTVGDFGFLSAARPPCLYPLLQSALQLRAIAHEFDHCLLECFRQRRHFLDVRRHADPGTHGFGQVFHQSRVANEARILAAECEQFIIRGRCPQ
jgi:hypothetical protein